MLGVPGWPVLRFQVSPVQTPRLTARLKLFHCYSMTHTCYAAGKSPAYIGSRHIIAAVGRSLPIPNIYRSTETMSDTKMTHPEHYTRTVRTLIRFALIMIVVSLLAGVAYQESSKKLPLKPISPEFSRWDATVHLALVHGHVMLVGVLVPVALAGMMHLARAHGGRDLGPRGLAWGRRLYLPFSTITIVLMLYKSYHILLSARFGKTDLTQIDAALFGGSTALRHGIYGLSHVGMAVGLCIFVWCLWRSLKPARS